MKTKYLRNTHTESHFISSVDVKQYNALKFTRIITKIHFLHSSLLCFRRFVHVWKNNFKCKLSVFCCLICISFFERHWKRPVLLPMEIILKYCIWMTNIWQFENPRSTDCAQPAVNLETSTSPDSCGVH